MPFRFTCKFRCAQLQYSIALRIFYIAKDLMSILNYFSDELEKGTDVYKIDVNTTLTVMKPVHAKWVIGLYDHLRNSSDIITKGFEKAGITEAIAGLSV